jgi:hypothetical protein
MKATTKGDCPRGENPLPAPGPLAGTLCRSDPGDETQRNFRYQHAYGVILLLAALRGNLPYSSLWCEHHEDFLAERHDGKYDAYQIKTRQPEKGYWTLLSDDLKHTLKRFVALDISHPDQVEDFIFVSNALCLETQSKSKLAHSPQNMKRALAAARTVDKLEDPYAAGFEALREYCGCNGKSLAQVFRRLELRRGPGRNDFESVISIQHVAAVPGCNDFPPAKLHSVRDELIQRVYKASSLGIPSPAEHYLCLTDNSLSNPIIQSKRISLDSVHSVVEGSLAVPFRFMPEEDPLPLGDMQRQVAVLHKKMVRGGILDQFDTMKRRALSAERHLMELAHRQPENFENLLNQIECVVKGVCDDALLVARQSATNFGPLMLSKVLTHLHGLARDRAELVVSQEYECLAGVVGLLTGGCKVWWSDKFDLEESP